MRDNVYGAPPSGDRFTDRRRTGVGGSDAGVILGVSPYQSALGLWEEKRGAPSVIVESERMLWGKRLERAILDGYAIDTGRKVRHTGRTFRRHPRHGFVIGHPDGITDDGRFVEVKVRSHLDDRWGESGSENVPAHFYAQVQHYLLLLELPVADLAALIGGREMRVYTIHANPAFQEALLEEEAAFWLRVVTNDPPPPDGSADAARALRALFPSTIEESIVATPEVAQYAERWMLARTSKQAAEKAEAEAGQLIQRALGARTRVVGERFHASWLPRAGSTSWKEVAATYRDLLVTRPNAPSDDELDAVISHSAGSATRVFSLTPRRPSDD